MFFFGRAPKLSKRNYDYISRCVHYVQGQSPKPHIREYFYFIDHQGQLFLDDSRIKNFTSCFKEKKFLEFFFKRLKTYNSGRYSREFPYVSLCGHELNYIRVDDLPIVFTHILETTEGEQLTYAHAGDLLTVPFQPQGLCMLPESGRVYHPAPSLPTGVGLIKSSLAIELSQTFEFGEGGDEGMPTHFMWKGKRWELNNEVIEPLRAEEERKQRLAEQTSLEDDVS